MPGDRQRVDIGNVARGGLRHRRASFGAVDEQRVGEPETRRSGCDQRPWSCPRLRVRTSSITIRPPSLACAESACRSARARTFFGRPVAWLRAPRDRTQRPPPRNRRHARRAVAGADRCPSAGTSSCRCAGSRRGPSPRGCQRWRFAELPLTTQRWMMSARGLDAEDARSDEARPSRPTRPRAS